MTILCNDQIDRLDMRFPLFSQTRSAFSLVELLVVISIIALLAALTSSAIGGIGSASTLTEDTSAIGDLLAQARTYAMGNSTYVYVGLTEVNGQTIQAGTGQVAVAVVAAQGGTRPYNNSPGQLPATGVVPITKFQTFANLHISSAATLTSGNMSTRPATTTLGFVDLGGDTISTVNFQWPLSGTARYNFAKVIEFDPQGVARVQSKSSVDDTVPSYIELPLQPTHGAAIATKGNNEAAIQIDGMTGIVRTYRP